MAFRRIHDNRTPHVDAAAGAGGTESWRTGTSVSISEPCRMRAPRKGPPQVAKECHVRLLLFAQPSVDPFRRPMDGSRLGDRRDLHGDHYHRAAVDAAGKRINDDIGWLGVEIEQAATGMILWKFTSTEGIDTLTNRRQEMSSLTSQFMLPRLSHRSKIDARRFETVDASDGSSNAVEH
jgi:hypothetical protein